MKEGHEAIALELSTFQKRHDRLRDFGREHEEVMPRVLDQHVLGVGKPRRRLRGGFGIGAAVERAAQE